MNGGEQLLSIIDQIKEHANVDTVYGEPIERNGRTIIPVARVGTKLEAGTMSAQSGLRARASPRTRAPEEPICLGCTATVRFLILPYHQKTWKSES